MKKIFLILPLILVSACVMKQKVLDAPAVSMTHSNVPEGKKLKQTGPVTGQFCTDSSHEGTYGLMDEAVKNAQKTSGADFLINASFFQTGGCMIVEGTGATIL